jgi:hypothetical protein
LKAEHKADSDEEDISIVVGGDDAYFDDNWYEHAIDKPGTPDKELVMKDFVTSNYNDK